LLTMLTAGVYGVVRDWDDNAGGLETTLDETIAVLQIERALLGAFPHSYRDPSTLARHVYFDGQRQELGWVSSVSPQRSSGLTAWRLYAVSGEGVYLQLAPALSDHPGQRLLAAESVLLLENYSLEFNYLYEDLNFNRRWRNDWPGKDLQALPMAVHVRLIPGRSSSLPERDIVAPVMATEHRSLRPQLELL
jgi:general secretion pathway protein J